MSDSTGTTEERIAAALSAHARGITMSTSTQERRLAGVRSRIAQDSRHRRRTVLGATAVAAAAAVLAVFALAGGLLDRDDRALPPAQPLPQQQRPTPIVGAGTPVTGQAYSVERFAVPFTFTLPDKGQVPGAWRYDVGTGEAFTVNFDGSPSTGFANVVLAAPAEAFDPSAAKPYTDQAPRVPAPVDADGWAQWLEQTGAATVLSREELDLGGVPATRLVVDVSDDLPTGSVACAPGESCLALSPTGPSLVGAAREGAFSSELTVIALGDRTLVVATIGLAESEDLWRPVLRSLVDSLRFS